MKINKALEIIKGSDEVFFKAWDALCDYNDTYDINIRDMADFDMCHEEMSPLDIVEGLADGFSTKDKYFYTDATNKDYSTNDPAEVLRAHGVTAEYLLTTLLAHAEGVYYISRGAKYDPIDCPELKEIVLSICEKDVKKVVRENLERDIAELERELARKRAELAEI